MYRKIQMTWYEKIMRMKVQHYNPEKYWKRRDKVVKYAGGGVLNKVVCTYLLYLVKRDDAFNNASIGTHLGIGNNVKTGANCIVTKDVPDNATIVLEQPKLIIH